MPHSTRLASSLFFAILLSALPALAQKPTSAARRPPVSTSHAGSPTVATSSVTPPYKGVFEPVNYRQDINFTDVFFVSPEVGWVSGDHATILKTTDGGSTWAPQIGGDANNNEKPIDQLRFLDERRGWAIADGPRLLRTLDGQNWDQVRGEFPRGSQVIDYTFTSVRHGILLASNNSGFFTTNDGGRHWQSTGPCQFTASVQGLTRTFTCYFIKLQMLSARSGYTVAWWSSPEDPNAASIVIFTTNDAGEHWTPIAPTLRDCCNPDAFFTDAYHGVIIYNNAKTYLTSDGGRNWHVLLSGAVGLTSSLQSPPIRFADPEVGWVLGQSPDNSNTYRVSFSTDAGQHWTMSHNLAFPVMVGAQLKFSFPRRDRAYVVGPHGMIYRYSIVPANYTAANALNGPAMPEFGGAELSAKADAIRREIELLRAKLSASLGQAAMASSSSASPRTGGFTQQVDTGSTSASTGFTQQTDTGSSPAGDTTGAFPQDSTPVSPALADCCSAALQTLQTDTSAFVQQAPAVGSQFKSLNLIVAGTQWAINLNSQARSVWSSFLALKHAANPQVASAALQQFSTGVNTAQQTGSTGAQNQGGWFASNAPADFTQDVGPGSSALPGSTVGPISGGPDSTAGFQR